MYKLSLCAACLLAACLLAACAEAAQPTSLPPSPTPLAFTPIGDVIRGEAVAPGADLTTIGYLYIDNDGARLVDGLSFSAGPTPQPLTDSADQIWVDDAAVASVQGELRPAGEARFVVCVARGRLEQAGGYGPDGRYAFRLADPQIQPAAPLEATIGALFERPATYQGRFVRIHGALIALPESALLVEQIGPGGVPAPQARQIKIQAPLRDTVLLEQLQRAPNDAVRFGQVQIEGFYRGQVLTPLALRLIS